MKKQKFLRKVFKIISKIFGSLKNLPYLCTRFDKEITFERAGVLKKSFLKIFPKIFGS
ncbi:MAG: hypothetical protein IKA01_02090 [Alistipes sp.]|nr:hypothetical protein [Alistipes sp.]